MSVTVSSVLSVGFVAYALFSSGHGKASTSQSGLSHNQVLWGYFCMYQWDLLGYLVPLQVHARGDVGLTIIVDML
jgi:hypothetical protein